VNDTGARFDAQNQSTPGKGLGLGNVDVDMRQWVGTAQDLNDQAGGIDKIVGKGRRPLMMPFPSGMGSLVDDFHGGPQHSVLMAKNCDWYPNSGHRLPTMFCYFPRRSDVGNSLMRLKRQGQSELQTALSALMPKLSEISCSS
jgi:hypothetical protein